ncbi:MAG: pyrroline-5-carboxylate reductase [Microbacterium sp.]|uniref:pyrroline-5-carboxylate reductase n=1 Tax=Microbacterium sp. TaxID=51671 RepID=UPI0039E5E8AF
MSDADMPTPGEPLGPVAILGVGAMGGAILQGLLDSDLDIEGGIRIADSWPDRIAELSRATGVTGYDGATDPDANARAVDGARVVIAAVKPHQMAELLDQIRPSLGPDTVLISIAAGVPTSAIESRLPDRVAVVRVMPNSPARVGQAVTGVAAGSRARPSHVRVAMTLCATIGTAVAVPEEMLDPLTSISGSGPAYVFLFIEALIAAARERGFDADTARLLVVGTFRGAIALMETTGSDPAALREQVTSPGGTTQAALDVFATRGLGDIVDAATVAAVERAHELAGS